MIQKIIKVGNSAAVTIPKEFLQEARLKIGDELDVETNGNLRMLLAKPKGHNTNSSLTPEFKNWLDNFIKEYKPVLEELAHL